LNIDKKLNSLIVAQENNEFSCSNTSASEEKSPENLAKKVAKILISQDKAPSNDKILSAFSSEALRVLKWTPELVADYWTNNSSKIIREVTQARNTLATNIRRQFKELLVTESFKNLNPAAAMDKLFMSEQLFTKFCNSNNFRTDSDKAFTKAIIKLLVEKKI